MGSQLMLRCPASTGAVPGFSVSVTRWRIGAEGVAATQDGKCIWFVWFWVVGLGKQKIARLASKLGMCC